jgi:hypothetical protein
MVAQRGATANQCKTADQHGDGPTGTEHDVNLYRDGTDETGIDAAQQSCARKCVAANRQAPEVYGIAAVRLVE